MIGTTFFALTLFALVSENVAVRCGMGLSKPA